MFHVEHRARRPPGRCFTWNIVEAARRPARALGRPSPERSRGSAPERSAAARPASTSGASSARGSASARTVTVGAGGPWYSSCRSRRTRTSRRPAARAASRRKAQRRCARLEQRRPAGRGAAGPAPGPGEPLPEPMSSRRPGRSRRPRRGTHRRHQQPHALRRRARAGQVDAAAPGRQQVEVARPGPRRPRPRPRASARSAASAPPESVSPAVVGRRQSSSGVATGGATVTRRSAPSPTLKVSTPARSSPGPRGRCAARRR